MKKFLSIFVAVAMVFSLFAGTFAPRASAAAGLTMSTADASKKATATSHYYFNSFASPLARNVLGAGNYVYKMGDVIHANVVFDTTTVGGEYVTELMAWDGADWTSQIIDSVTAFQTTLQATGLTNEGLKTYPVQIGTGNVSYDGPYYLRVRETAVGGESYSVGPLYIQYNLTWKTSTIINCAGFNTIEGWITRGNGQTVLVPVIVGITYPVSGVLYDLAAYYTVAPSSSGQFSLTFPVDPANHIGDFGVFVRDSYADDAGYPTAPAGGGVNVTSEATQSADNDAMIYTWLSNSPTDLAITASTYYSPVLLYKGVAEQPLVLQVVDQNGAYIQDATWTISAGAVFHQLPIEIAPGFYRFLLDIASPATGDVRLTAHKMVYGSDEESTVIINLRELGSFNPYIDVNAANDGTNVWSVGAQVYQNWTTITPTPDCKTGRNVYNTLPCTIGSALFIKADYWDPIDPENWYVYDFTATVNGPVREITYPKTWATTNAGTFIIEEAGKISVSVSMTMWERVLQPDADGIEHSPCVDWFSGSGWALGHFGSETTPLYHDGGFAHGVAGRYQDGWTPEAENACCRTYEKTFDICEVKSCALVGVTLENGAQTTATSIDVGKKADLVINVSGANAPAGLSCGCNTKIVRIYMRKCVAGASSAVTGAFTYDTWAGDTLTVSELWYNGITGSFGKRTPDQPFSPDTYKDGVNVMLPDDGTVTFADTTAGAIVVDNCEKLTFKGIKFNYTNDQDAPCGYQLVVETFGLNRSFDACGNMYITYPFISETLNDIDITPAVTTLTTTPTVYELGVDPIDLLAGVPATIEITDPKFTVDTPSALWTAVEWSYTFNGTADYILQYYDDYPLMTSSKLDAGYKFTFNCGFPEAGTLVITGTSWLASKCASKQVVTITLKVVLPAFDVQIELADGSKIANDHIITEGITELIHVVPTDPRADGHHDFTTDTTWNLKAFAVKNDCGLPTSAVCSSTPVGCTTPSPVAVYGLDNPNLEDVPQFDLYMTFGSCPGILIDTFSLVEPTVTVSPTEVPFTIPASATHLVFTVKDAHGHGAPGVMVTITGTEGTFGAGASGYSFVAGYATTDKTGEADWAFVPPFSGQYKVGISMPAESCFVLPCGWSAFAARKTITAKYQAPVVDTTAPVVTITAGIDGSKVTSATLNLTGKVTDNVGVTQLFVGFNKVDVLPDGSFMAPLKLVAGENTITVVAYDAAGNKGTTTAKVTYTAPVDTSIVLVLTIGADIVSVNGKATSIDAAPEIVASRTYVPMRFIAESFGATVEWLPETQGITITLGEHTVGLQIGNATAVVDGTIISLPAAPYIKNGRTMVPLRLISEAFGGDVVWDAATRTITITYQP
jgi:hypothetical protein